MALAAGALVGSQAGNAEEAAARDFTEAWVRGDERAMYRLIGERARASWSFERFRRAYDRAAATATLVAVAAEEPDGTRAGSVVVPMTLRTRVFGRLRGDLLVPVEEERVAWMPRMVFPELREGERLSRRSRPAERATLLSRNRRVLAEGPADARSSPLVGVADSIAGSMEPEETREERTALYARGFPQDWPVGQSGLEEAFEDRLAGRPGGELLAGRRVLARARPRPAPPVRTSIDTRIQEAAVVGLAGRFGGIAAIDPRNGEIRALAGIAFSAPQPPGSTFKIITTTAALEDGLVKLSDEFPVETAATIDGVQLNNANGEACGGNFRESFAHSCNSVFAPLGVKVGSERLVEVAERYGWNAEPTIPGELASTLPPAVEIKTPLEVGSTAIGQGKLLATPLRLASVGAGDRRRRRALRAHSGRRRGEPPCAGDLPPGGAHHRLADGGRGGLRHRHGLRDHRREGGGQDRHGRARGHPRSRGRRGQRRVQHRRLVHRLRAPAAPADRGGGHVRPGRIRRRHGGPGGAGGARGGAEALAPEKRPKGPTRR